MTRSQWAAFALILILAASLLAANVGVDPAAGQADQTTNPTDRALRKAPPQGRPAPDLVDLAGWLNTSGGVGPAMGGATGSVRVVVFWSANCDYCLASLANIEAIADRWADRGLVVVAVHSPQSPAAANPQLVADTAAEVGWNRPVARDDSRTNLKAWQPTSPAWPRAYVVDQNGVIRFDRTGNEGFDELEATVAYLLENGA